MDFKLDELQLMIQKTARDFANLKLMPRAHLADDEPSFGEASLELLRHGDYFGILIPEEYGGAGMTSFEYMLVTEEMARGCLSTAAILGAHNLLIYPMLLAANDEQKKRYFPALASGELIGAFALTEPDTGSDVSSLATTAEEQNHEYVLNGSKQFITNGGYADLIVVFAATDRSKGHSGISAFLVEKGTPGLHVGKKENKMGIRGTSTVQLIFSDCRVPAKNMLGKKNEGFKLAMMVLDRARPGIGAQAVGLAQAALDLAVDYVQQRVVFGQPLSEFQNTRFTIAEMAMQVEAARTLVYKAAWLATHSTQRFSKESSMAKLFATQVAHFVVDRSLQLHGGYGFMKEYTIERLYRDERILEIYEGTSEIQKMVIAGSVLN